MATLPERILSVGTVVPDGPFFRNAEDSVPYCERFGFPCIKGAGFFNRLGLKKTWGFFYKIPAEFNGIGFQYLSQLR